MVEEFQIITSVTICCRTELIHLIWIGKTMQLVIAAHVAVIKTHVGDTCCRVKKGQNAMALLMFMAAVNVIR